MNKQHVKNYFRGYNNKFRDKVYKSKDDHAFYLTNLLTNYFLGALICACAAESLAIGTLYGEQET